uniref:Late embryogenesis abundant protein LEA-2 subgroup domain-containing protein n=1 Tax=Leersia perrieri TaxID=77586 RepID=A0A0D9WL72_9ORYZ
MGGGEEEGRGKTVPCLVAVRYLVATAVGVIAIAVVLMVIGMVRRPEEIHVVIERGLIAMHHISHSVAYLTGSMSIGNPSGRGVNGVSCKNITVGLVDIASNSPQPMLFQLTPGVAAQRINSINYSFAVIDISTDFQLPKQSWHSVQMYQTLDNRNQINYMEMKENQTSTGTDGFPVLVMVHLFVSSSRAPAWTPHTFYCWPIIIVKVVSGFYLTASVSYIDDAVQNVECLKMANSMQVPSLLNAMAPPPSPAPSPN